MSHYRMERGWMEHPVFAPEPFTEREAWEWMIAEAAWKPCQVRVGNAVVDLERGQLAFSLRFLASKWQWTLKRVRVFLERLRKHGMLGTAKGTAVTVISIMNYDTYQSSRSLEGHSEGHARGTAGAQQGHSRGTKKKEVKKDRREEGEEEEGAPAVAGECVTLPTETQQAVDLWNALAEQIGLPCVQRLTDSRRAALRSRLRECGGLDGWGSALERIRGSPGLHGDNDRGWRADFDWLCKAGNFTKLMEGKYDGWSASANRKGPPSVVAAMRSLLDEGEGYGGF